MPTTLSGLLIFLVLLAPGLTYSTFRASSLPVDKPTAWQELSGIVLRSAIFDGAALSCFALLRVRLPNSTPDVGLLVRDSESYARDHYAQLTVWGTGLALLACLLALGAARAAASPKVLDVLDAVGLVPHGRGTKKSAWWLLFEGGPEGSKVYAGCVLEDNTYVGGWVNSYSPDSDETPDRELTLASPITYRAAGSTTSEEVPLSAISVSARRMSYLTVTYVVDETDIDETDIPG